jgi:hypothetical protein
VFSVCYWTFPGNGSNNSYFSVSGSGPLFMHPHTELIIKWLNWSCSLHITYQYGPCIRRSSFICYSPTIALLRICCLAMRTCLWSRCPETPLIYPPILQSLDSNGSTCSSIYKCLKLSLHDSSCFTPAVYLTALLWWVNIRVVSTLALSPYTNSIWQ